MCSYQFQFSLTADLQALGKKNSKTKSRKKNQEKMENISGV